MDSVIDILVGSMLISVPIAFVFAVGNLIVDTMLRYAFGSKLFYRPTSRGC